MDVPRADMCDCCGKGAYRTRTFYYLEAWAEDYVAGDGMGFSQRKKRLLCGECGEAVWKQTERKKEK